MRACLIALLAGPWLTSCLNPLAIDDPGPQSLPPDNPGYKLDALSVGSWPVAWNAKTGRLIVSAHTGARIGKSPVYPVSFAILSFDPATKVVDTLARQQNGGGLRGLGVADASGAVLFSYSPDLGNSVALRRVHETGVNDTISAAKAMVSGEVHVSADGRTLVTRSSYVPAEITVTNLTTGALVRTLSDVYPMKLSPDGGELLDGGPGRVHRIADGSSRSIAPGLGAMRIMDARWTDGRVTVLGVQSNHDVTAQLVLQWDEATGRTDTLGVINGLWSLVRCARFLPQEKSAVVMFDSVFTGLFSNNTRTHARINVVSPGVSRSIGSVNQEDDESVEHCAVSQDGNWFAYRVWNAALYVTSTK